MSLQPQTFKDQYAFEGKIGDQKVKIFGTPNPETGRATVTSALTNHGYPVKVGGVTFRNGAWEGELSDGRSFRLIACTRFKLAGGADGL